MRPLFVPLAIAALAAILPDPSSAQRPEPTVFMVFEADTMYTVLPPDAIPAIREPGHVTGEAAKAQMSSGEPVIGVAVGDDAVCWSTWHLDRHEIVNDHVDGRAIAATW
jgi:hypothetical protein